MSSDKVSSTPTSSDRGNVSQESTIEEVGSDVQQRVSDADFHIRDSLAMDKPDIAQNELDNLKEHLRWTSIENGNRVVFLGKPGWPKALDRAEKLVERHKSDILEPRAGGQTVSELSHDDRGGVTTRAMLRHVALRQMNQILFTLPTLSSSVEVIPVTTLTSLHTARCGSLDPRRSTSEPPSRHPWLPLVLTATKKLRAEGEGNKGAWL
nr:uncharacterized protein CI109_004527 [Kwoniella shandongensis]KAA5527234.1 hypothetical protein CI109_004527 [Kwoniella shandongensis]